MSLNSTRWRLMRWRTRRSYNLITRDLIGHDTIPTTALLSSCIIYTLCTGWLDSYMDLQLIMSYATNF